MNVELLVNQSSLKKAKSEFIYFVDDSTTYGALLNNFVAGIVQYRGNRIFALEVLSDYRLKGIGTQLLTTALKKIKPNASNAYVFLPEDDFCSQKFFIKNDFEFHKSDRDHYIYKRKL